MPVDIDKLQIEIEADSAQAGSALDRLTASLQRLQNAVGGNTALQRTSQQVKNIAKAPSLTKLERELSKVEKQAIKDGDSLVKLQERLEELQGYKGIGTKLTQADTASKIKETTAQIRQLSDAVDSADARIRELRKSIKDVQAGNIPTVQAPTTTSKTTSANIPQAAAQIRQAATAPQGVGNAAAQVKTNLDAASKSADIFGRRVKKATSSGSGGFAYLARSIKGMVVNFALFGVLFSLTNSIGDSFQRMAQENQEVDQTLSSIKSSLQYVSDSLASAVYPIIKAIAPIIVTILDAVAQIFNFIALIIATITGQEHAIQAEKVQTSFAESLDGTANSMDDVTDAAKRMKNAVIGIDELNIISPPDGSKLGGGTGGTGGISDSRFETVDLPFTMPSTLPSPSWQPDPVPAPSFAPVAIPDYAGEKMPSPSWQPELVPSPVFAAVSLPDWVTNPLPVPEWEANPIPAPAIDSSLLTAGLKKLAENVKENLGAVVEYVRTVVPAGLANAEAAISSWGTNTSAAIRSWGANVAANIRTTLQYIPTASAEALTAAGQAMVSWINATSTNFASWGGRVVEIAGATAEGLYTNIVSGLKSAWDQFVSFMKGIGEKIAGFFHANLDWIAPAVGIGLAGLAIGAIAISGGGALAAAPALAALPMLANGGVITEPTVALMGEYPGAGGRNPEIVSPKSLLEQTFRQAQDTDTIVSAMRQMTTDIIAAIYETRTSVYLDGKQIANAVNKFNRQRGASIMPNTLV